MSGWSAVCYFYALFGFYFITAYTQCGGLCNDYTSASVLHQRVRGADAVDGKRAVSFIIHFYTQLSLILMTVEC